MTLTQRVHRPVIHFTAERNWLNDPNGLVYLDGEWHLFFQHNPTGMLGAGQNMHWGHAVSRDLLHWIELPIALHVQGQHQAYSGSAVIDWNNTSGLGFGPDGTPPLVAVYTRTGIGQCLAVSYDRGRTFEDRWRHPVLTDGDRDPKVFWHAPTERWVMVLYQGKGFTFYNSPDLHHWIRQSHIEGFYECPDLIELPVVDEPGRTEWVLVDGDGSYVIGRFDGQKFLPRSDKLRSDFGPHFYATQTWSNVPPSDGRTIQIAWARGGHFANQPFSQQMTIPVELSLRRSDEGLRLHRAPVRELTNASRNAFAVENCMVAPGRPLVLPELPIPFRLHLGLSDVTAKSVELRLGTTRLRCDPTSNLIDLDGYVVVVPEAGRFGFEAVVDLTSVEIFGNDGAWSLTKVCDPGDSVCSPRISVNDGGAIVRAATHLIS